MEQLLSSFSPIRRPLKTFLLDDNIDDLMNLKEQLEMHPGVFEIVISKSYSDALNTLALAEFHLSILDYKLDNNKDIFDLLLTIERNKFGIIALSSIVTDELAIKSLEISEPLLLPKPHVKEVISKFLIRLMERVEKERKRRLNTFTILNVKNEHMKLIYEKIYYIVGDQKTTKFIYESENPNIEYHTYVHKGMIGEVYNEIDKMIFYKCHKSFIVNLDRIAFCKSRKRNAEIYFKKRTSHEDILSVTVEASPIGVRDLKSWGFIRQ